MIYGSGGNYEQECDGSGRVVRRLPKLPGAVEGFPVNKPCPGCRKCRPCERCKGSGDDVDHESRLVRCPVCHGTGIAPVVDGDEGRSRFLDQVTEQCPTCERVSLLASIASCAWRVREVLHLNIADLAREVGSIANRNFADMLNDLNAHLPLVEDGADWYRDWRCPDPFHTPEGEQERCPLCDSDDPAVCLQAFPPGPQKGPPHPHNTATQCCRHDFHTAPPPSPPSEDERRAND